MAAPKKKVKIKKVKGKSKRVLKKKPPLERHAGNPIIGPKDESSWQSRAAFNAAALEHDGKVHVIYRAVGDDDVSRLGYAVSRDGLTFSDHSEQPIFTHRSEAEKSAEADFSASFIQYHSGGGTNGGSEEPRLVNIDNKVHLLYTAFDGWGSVRIALSSISLPNFLNKIWRWKTPVMISPPNQINKNWVLFPEKINGEFAILHSIAPKILIDYVDNLNEFDGHKFINSISRQDREDEVMRTGIRGVGPPPLKTKIGWLILYHAMDLHERHRYKLWALISDLKEPTKILYRSKRPILEPDATYENDGWKAGVVYSCGAIIKEKNLFVYYGGADKVTCVATTNLDKFLDELKKTGKVKLLKTKTIKK